MRICFGCSRLPTRLLFSCAMVAAVTLQSTAESTQGGPNPLVCLGHFSGSFSAHESMALNSSPQIQDTLIASNSKSQAAAPWDFVGHRESPEQKEKATAIPHALGTRWIPGLLISSREMGPGRGDGNKGKRWFMGQGSPAVIRGFLPFRLQLYWSPVSSWAHFSSCIHRKIIFSVKSSSYMKSNDLALIMYVSIIVLAATPYRSYYSCPHLYRWETEACRNGWKWQLVPSYSVWLRSLHS